MGRYHIAFLENEAKQTEQKTVSIARPRILFMVCKTRDNSPQCSRFLLDGLLRTLFIKYRFECVLRDWWTFYIIHDDLKTSSSPDLNVISIMCKEFCRHSSSLGGPWPFVNFFRRKMKHSRSIRVSFLELSI